MLTLLRGLHALPYSTSAASDGGSGGAAGIAPVYTCDRQVCRADDYPTTQMFQAVGKFLNALYDNSRFLSGPAYVALQNAVKAQGITWAREDGVIDENTAKFYRAIVSTTGVNVGQGIDTPNDRAYLAKNAPRIVAAISETLASMGIDLPPPTYAAQIYYGATATPGPTTDTGAGADTGAGTDTGADTDAGADTGADTGGGGGRVDDRGDAQTACNVSGGYWDASTRTCVYLDAPPPKPKKLPTWAKPAMIGVGAGLAFLLLFRKR